jgi:hypothetical protein
MGKKKRLKLERVEEQAPAPKTERRALSKGVVIFGVLLILSSISHMLKLSVERTAFDEYYSYYPAWLMPIRYYFSWLQRILGILAGIGILARKEIARKLAFVIGGFTVLTVYWKHPYEAVKLHAAHLDQQYGYLLTHLRENVFPTTYDVTFSSIAPLGVAGLILCDFVFWGIFFYFFTRPSVRDQFRPSA